MTLAKSFTANATPAEGDFIPSWLAAEGSGSERKTTLAQLRTALLGTSSYAVGDILYASSSTALAKLADVATGNVLRSGGVTTAPAWGKVDVTTDITGTQPAANGGTGIASYAIGDILYASGATALSKLADVATGNVLTSGGVTTAPAWGKAVLTTHVSGVLPEANGGTNQSTYTQGDILYASASNTLSKLAKNVTATRSLTNSGTSNAPAWAQVDLTTGVTGTMPAVNGGTGNASYTIGDILQASGAAALTPLAAVATGNAHISGGVATATSWGKIGLTTHVSGTLAAANGGTGAASYAVGDILYASGTTALSALADVATGNVLISGGVTTAPSWGKVTLGSHVTGTLAANRGGTGFSGYAVGDILCADSSTTLAKLPDVATGNVLISGGVTTVPAWGKVDLAAAVTGALPVANGGLALTSATAGDILYASATDTWAKLAKSTSSTRVLTNTGASNIPAWAQVDLTTGVTGVLPLANGGAATTKRPIAVSLRFVPTQTLGATPGVITGASVPAESFQTWDFDPSTIWYLDVFGVMSGILPASTGCTLKFVAASSATSGNFIFNAAFRRLTAVDWDTTAFTYTTNAQASATLATSGTAGTPTAVSIAFSTGTNMNSVVAGDPFILRIWRDATNVADTVNSNTIRLLEPSLYIEEQ